MITLPAGAMHRYEQIRAGVLENRACRTGVAAIRFHGMARGLVQLAAATSAVTPSAPLERHESAGCLPETGFGPELVRLMANMVLQIESGDQHVY
ncbi:MAG: hypothetical protein OXU26_07725 [Acidobacteriota bacterium]|nr:hypothetical protein [Acidobacteriota bacterium]